MEVWILVVITYLAVGLFCVLIGPAARQRRVETEILEWQSYDQPRWKLKAFAAAIALGIILLWPILVISAKRKESSPINDTADLEEIQASAELSSRISGPASNLQRVLDRPAELPSWHLSGDHSEFSRSNLSPSLRPRREIRNRADPREHAAVFSVQHLFCSIRGNTILDSHSDSLGASFVKDRAGHSVSNQF